MTQPSLLDLPLQPVIKGPDVAPHDQARLGAQFQAVRALLLKGEWWTLRAISDATGYPEASVSARLRDCRRIGDTVLRERAAPKSGQWKYKLTK